MGKKNLVLILGFAILTLFSGKVHAETPETLCAKNTPGYPPQGPPFGNSVNFSAVMLQYDNCVAETRRTQTEQQNAPPNPGAPPTYDCAQYQQPGVPEWKFTKCQGEFDGAKAKYDADLKTYQAYMSAHPEMNTIKELSAAQVVEDIAAKQQKTSDKLKRIANILKITGGTLMAAGGIMIATGTALLVASLGGSTALIAAGGVVLALGIALTIAAAVIDAKASKIANEKTDTCEKLNKLVTHPIKCDDVKEQTPGDHTLTVTDYGFNGSNGTGEIPPYIDPTTGKCKANAPAECSTIVKESPAGCFKVKPGAKPVSCMAGRPSPVKVLANGKVSANINGKQRTFGAEDFTNEASMMKAGFTKDQAKQFFSMANDPNSILARNGVNVKGELIKGTGIPTTSLSTPSRSSDSVGTSGTTGMNSKKDEYGPVQEVARTPASAEGLTKDYHGDTIGAEGDNVFKMINRRYNLKQKQNIFIEQ